MNPDGTMARLPQLLEFAEKHNIKIGSIESLIQYRLQTETFIEEKAHSLLPSRYGKGFSIRVFHNRLDGHDHVAIVKGNIDPEQPVMVRVHSECLMGDVFRSLRTRSGDYLEASLRRIEEEGSGILVYLRLED